MDPLIGIVNQVKADRERDVHLGQKARASAEQDLVWERLAPDLLSARVEGGVYQLRKVDSGSRVPYQRFRWRIVWRADTGYQRELALERRQEWAKAAAEIHYRRMQS